MTEFSKETDGTLRLYCPAGFKYEGLNEVTAVLNGVNVSRAVADLVNAFTTGPKWEGQPRLGLGDGVFYSEGAESFTIHDLAICATDVLSLRVEVSDGGRVDPGKTWDGFVQYMRKMGNDLEDFTKDQLSTRYREWYDE